MLKMTDSRAANENFKGLKDSLLELDENLTKETTYMDFHASLAILDMAKELHASLNDNDKSKLEAQKRSKESGYKYEAKWYTADGVDISLRFETPKGLGLAPVDGDRSMDCCWGNYYQDEWSNIEGTAYPSRSTATNCKCYVCSLKQKPKEHWGDIDYKAAEYIIKVLEVVNKGDKVTQENMRFNVRRTDGEMRALEAMVNDKTLKSYKGIFDLVKSLYKGGMSKERIKKFIKDKFDDSRLFTKSKEIKVDDTNYLFKSFDADKEKIDKKKEEISKVEVKKSLDDMMFDKDHSLIRCYGNEKMFGELTKDVKVPPTVELTKGELEGKKREEKIEKSFDKTIFSDTDTFSVKTNDRESLLGDLIK